jgi:hypothetical protein
MELVKRISRSLGLTQANDTGMIRLIPLAMVIPNWEGVYSYSRLRQPKLVTREEWYTYNAQEIKVGTPNNWRYVTAYGKGLSCWYLAVEVTDGN